MDFVELTRRSCRDVHDATSKEALQRLGRALERVGDLPQLVEQNDPVIDPFDSWQLFRLVAVYKDWLSWKDAARNLRRELAASKVQLPDGSLALTTCVHELRALGRVARMCPRSGSHDHASWGAAVQAHLELWRACVEIATNEGIVSVALVDTGHPDAGEYESYLLSKEVLGQIRGYRWLGARRGEKAGVLRLEVELPADRLADQARARLPSLGPSAEKRGEEGVLAELVLDDLEPVVRSTIDRRARGEAVDSARRAYVSLLEIPPVESKVLLAVYVGGPGTGTGAAIMDRGGGVIAEATIPRGDDPGTVLEALVAEHQPDTAALPVAAEDHARLTAVELALGEMPAVRVHTAALAEARDRLSFDKEIGSAVVIGRRALRPTREWGKIDPLSLGLGEFPREIDPDELREALVLARRVASWERHRRRKSGKATPGGVTAARSVRGAALNPLVRAIQDLKSGMTVNGVITNVTRFGAFVNIGLRTEAMIHVSQLANEFVEEPSQVVRVGQQVSARVIEVQPEKNRIALSLKPPPEREQRFAALPPLPDGAGQPQTRTREWPPAKRRSSNDRKNRSAALADLDALFKK